MCHVVHVVHGTCGHIHLFYHFGVFHLKGGWCGLLYAKGVSGRCNELWGIMAVEEVELIDDEPVLGTLASRFLHGVNPSGDLQSEPAFDISDSTEHLSVNVGEAFSDSDKQSLDNFSELANQQFGHIELESRPLSPSIDSWEELPETKEVPLSSSYDADAIVDASWKNISDQGLKQFWESDFWENLFDPSVTAIDSMTRGLKRPLQPQHVVESLDQDELVEHRIAKRIAADTCPAYLHCVTDSVECSWMEEREAKWEVAIRGWVSLIDSWQGDTHICKLLHEKSDFRGKAQI